MELERTPLLTELARPSVSVTGRSKPLTIHGQRRRYNAKHKHKRPKKRTRRVSTRAILGGTRRGLLSRLERRTRENALPSIEQILRSRQRIIEKRRKTRVPLLKGHRSPRSRLLKGFHL